MCHLGSIWSAWKVTKPHHEMGEGSHTLIYCISQCMQSAKGGVSIQTSVIQTVQRLYISVCQLHHLGCNTLQVQATSTVIPVDLSVDTTGSGASVYKSVLKLIIMLTGSVLASTNFSHEWAIDHMKGVTATELQTGTQHLHTTHAVVILCWWGHVCSLRIVNCMNTHTHNTQQ